MSQTYRPGDSVTREFITSSFSTGAATNADSLPVGTVNHNGTDDGAVTVTVTNIDTGRYKAVFTIPSTYLAGDDVNLSIAATVGGVAGKAVPFSSRLGAGIIRSGVAQGGAAGTITLDAGASATTNAYEYLWVQILAGTGAGQARFISAYNASTKVASVLPNWITNPDSTSVFLIVPAAGVDVENLLGSAVSVAPAVPANMTQINGVSLTETTPGNIANSLAFFFNVQPTTNKTVNYVGFASF